MSELTSKYGKVLFVFCGGGCKAIIQAVAASEVVKAGLTPSHIISSSAGSCNALGFVENPGPVGAENTIRIWEDYITSPEAIYEVHPFFREKLTRLLGVVPRATQDWGPSGSILHDLRRAMKFVPLILSFCARTPLRVAGRTVSFIFRLMDTFESQHKSFRRLVQCPEIQEAFDEVDKFFEFKRMKAFLDPFPLLARLGEQIDLKKVLTSSTVWHILTERYEDGATVMFSALIDDAAAKGARVLAGGSKGDGGFFFQPTLLADVPNEADIMNEEPFGPVAVTRSFSTFDEVIEQANRLPFGLAAFAFTENGRRANLIGDLIESGMVGINTFAISVADAPFGGVKDSGFGSEGGKEGLESYQVVKAIHQA